MSYLQPIFIFLPAMKRICLFVGICLCCLSIEAQESRSVLFDNDWRFKKGHPVHAESPEYNDADWRRLDLPHDWSIEDLPDQKADSIIGPFSKTSVGTKGTGFTVGGTAWYRKNFTVNSSDKDKITFLQFDGVYMNSDVWINGKHVGNHPYGYTSFFYDITSFLNPAGQSNVVAVEVKNEGKNARWYSGSGIYRHTWLTLVDPVHIGMWGVYITTPIVSEKSADIEVSTNVSNSAKEDALVTLNLEIIDPSGNVAGTAENNTFLKAGSSNEIKQKVTIEKPVLWTTENPVLYKSIVSVFVKNKKTDQVNTSFGIRSIHFDAQTGFTLNGKTMKLRGGCIHHDNGPLGSAAIDRAEERKIELLKSVGYNAIRCSHNPPSPYLLEVCDRLGMLVIDEFTDMWEKPKVNLVYEIFGAKTKTFLGVDDYSRYFKNSWKQDLESMVLRDRNHPSVIMWSIGNEISEATDTSGFRIAKALIALVHQFDPTRAVTEAMTYYGGDMADKNTLKKQALHMDLLDVVGFNYNYNDYIKNHEKHPNWIMYGSESMPPLFWENWQMVERLPYVIGDFTWAAMDYMGEAGVGIPRLEDAVTKNTNLFAQMNLFYGSKSWPAFNSYQGVIDLIGNRKTASYFQSVVWRKSKVEMFVHRPIPARKKEITSPWGFPDEVKSWTWPNKRGENLQVHVYTRSSLVRLELNGKVVGQQTMDKNKSMTATFEVPYEEGELTAYCYDNWRETGSERLKTLGKPASIRLIADRNVIKANKNDLSYITLEITDSNGNVIPNADAVLIKFGITGNGKIAGVGNGNPVDMSSFQQPQKRTYQGKCLVIICPDETPGTITLTAKADGLKDSSVVIKTE